MLLHIFRLEAKASLSGRQKRIGAARAASASARRVEDIIGKGSAVVERMPVMPQTVLLRSELSPALGVSPRERIELGSGLRQNLGAPRRKRKERPLWGSTARKAFLPGGLGAGIMHAVHLSCLTSKVIHRRFTRFL
jgi:hypothetical protein